MNKSDDYLENRINADREIRGLYCKCGYYFGKNEYGYITIVPEQPAGLVMEFPKDKKGKLTCPNCGRVIKI